MSGEDTKGLYPLITDTQNIAGSKNRRQVSVKKGYGGHVSAHDEQLNACEESL